MQLFNDRLKFTILYKKNYVFNLKFEFKPLFTGILFSIKSNYDPRLGLK